MTTSGIFVVFSVSPNAQVGRGFVFGEKEMTIDFRQWVHNQIKARQCTLREISDLTGIDSSNISLLLNEKTQPTLRMATRLCRGWKISLPQLLQELGVPHQFPLSTVVQEELTDQDIKGLVEYTHHATQQQWHAFRQWITETLNVIISEDGKKEGGENRFSLRDIDRILEDHPLFSLTIHYPSHMDPRTLQALYIRGGLITFVDVDVYLKHHYRGQRSILPPISQDGAIHIHLEKLFGMDARWEQQGLLIGLFWEACQFQELLNDQKAPGKSAFRMEIMQWTKRDTTLIFLFITLYRWLQCMKQEEVWLRLTRKLLQGER